MMLTVTESNCQKKLLYGTLSPKKQKTTSHYYAAALFVSQSVLRDPNGGLLRSHLRVTVVQTESE